MSRRMIGDHDAVAPAAKDSEPSSYFSLSEAVPGRSHSGSMDVTDVSYAPRLGSDLRGGEILLEEDAPDYNPEDDSTSDEGSPHPRQSLDQHHQQQLMMDNGTLQASKWPSVAAGGGDGGMELLNSDGIDPNASDSGGLGPGIALGGGLEDGGKADDGGVRGEAAGGIGLEPLELPPPADGPGGTGISGDGGVESPKSSPLGQGPGLEALTLEAAETEKASKASPALAGVSGGAGVGGGGGGGGGGGAVDTRGPVSGGHKIWLESSLARDSSGSGGGGGGGGGGDLDGGGGVSGGAGGNERGGAGPTTREMRCSSAASSSSDDTMAGNARLSAPAMKQQWEEAMSGANTPETPHRSRRGSTSMDGSVGRGGVGVGLFSPGAARGLASSFGPVDGVVTRSGRAGSVNGIGSGSFNTTGGGGGGGGGIGSGIGGGGASVLGSHLRTYGWVKDEEVSECMNACGAEFSALERRHHCRCCGAIFCENCSRHRCLVPEPVAPPGKDPLDPTRPHRVCNACYADVQASQEELLSTVTKARRHNDFNTDSAARHCNPPFGLDLAHEVRKSANTLNNVLTRRQGCDCDSLTVMVGPEQRVSHALWRGARGLVFVTVVKAGFLYAAEAGTGLCVARLTDGSWSAPAAVQTFGLSWGLQAGCEVVDIVIPLRTDAAVEMLKCGGQVYVKLDAAVAVGPMGRSVGSAVGGRSWPGEVPALDLAARYSMSKGLFAGFGVGAGFLRVADRVNERFYGAQVSPRTLLTGAMPRPPAANPLYSSLARLEQITGRQPADKRA